MPQPQPTKPARRTPRYPGWRHMTASQRHNARQSRIFEQAMIGRFGPNWRQELP